MDNLFTTINLFKFLKTEKIWAIETMWLNKMREAQKILKNKKQLTQEGCGSFDYCIDANSNIMLLTWLDNGPVQLISSFTGPAMGKPANQADLFDHILEREKKV